LSTVKKKIKWQIRGNPGSIKHLAATHGSSAAAKIILDSRSVLLLVN